jgi:hypothetical protein
MHWWGTKIPLSLLLSTKQIANSPQMNYLPSARQLVIVCKEFSPTLIKLSST